MKLSSSFRRSQSPEQGYVLMVILLLLALLLVSLVAIAPRMATEIRREREEEMVHRGKDYAMAVKRYFKKFGRYPTSIEQLENTNNIRFLRRRWTDPTTGKEFRLLHYGEQKSVPKGLFGASLGGGGALPGGAAGGGIPGAILNSTLGGGAQTQPQAGQSGTASQGGQDQGSQPGVSASSISSSLGTGQTFGGGPIIGVAGTKNQASLKTWQDKNNYKDWEFYYDPRYDVQTAGAVGGVPGGSPGGQIGGVAGPGLSGQGSGQQNQNQNQNPQPQRRPD